MFVRAVDIAADVLPGAPHVDHLIQFGQQLKDLAQRPPQTLAGLRHLEATFFTYWNETSACCLTCWVCRCDPGRSWGQPLRDHVSCRGKQATDKGCGDQYAGCR